jgi:YHS domain-containing protein
MSRRRSGSTLAPVLALAVALAAGASVPGDASRWVPTADKAHPRLKYDDSLTSINDRCAVKENELSPSIRPVYVNGQPVGFCCTTCPAIFIQGPEPYLHRMKASFIDPVRKVPAKIEAPLRYHVNWEVFYFADRASLDEFRKRPTAYCGWLTDPVNGVRFRPTASSPRVIQAGRSYFFTSDSTRVKFQAAPVNYAYRKGA